MNQELIWGVGLQLSSNLNLKPRERSHLRTNIRQPSLPGLKASFSPETTCWQSPKGQRNGCETTTITPPLTPLLSGADSCPGCYLELVNVAQSLCSLASNLPTEECGEMGQDALLTGKCSLCLSGISAGSAYLEAFLVAGVGTLCLIAVKTRGGTCRQGHCRHRLLPFGPADRCRIASLRLRR